MNALVSSAAPKIRSQGPNEYLKQTNRDASGYLGPSRCFSPYSKAPNQPAIGPLSQPPASQFEGHLRCGDWD
jgi:hypothetical protein